jgi:ribosomal protein S12 methylthiotransferase accessory factor
MEPPGRQTGRGLGFYHGFGSHLDATMALYRAIIEAVQGRVTFISGSRDDLLYAHYEAVREPELLEGMWREIIAGKPAARRWTGEPRLSTDSFEDDLRVLLAALEAAGFGSAIAVDLSRTDVGIPVVKVIVPGLEIIPDPGAEVGARYAAAQAQDSAVAEE